MIDAVNEIIRNLNEETVGADIAFLPGGFSTIANMFKKMAKKKTKWGIEILDTENAYEFKVEDQVKFTVQKPHVHSFRQESGISDFGMKELDLAEYVSEAKEADIGGLLNEIEKEVYSLLAKPPILTIDEDSAAWQSVFPGKTMTVKQAAFNEGTLEEDIENILSLIDVSMHEDVGNLQLLQSAIQRQKSLATFDVFSNYQYLFASVIKSNHKGTSLIFEGLIDLSFNMSEKIYCTNPDVLDAVSDITLVKVKKNVIYPTGQRFPYNFLRSIKNAIEEQ